MTDKTTKELTVAEKRAIERNQGEPTREGPTFMPQVDIIESPDAITLRADLPGVAKDGVRIDVHEDILTLSANVDPLGAGLRPVHCEYDVGSYNRRFTLGERIDQEKINAKMENGVLTLVMPKTEKHRPRKIEVR